jgi:hypothetical protein
MLIEGAGCAGLADAVLGAVALAAKYVAAAGITAQSTGMIIFVRSPRFLGLVLGDPDDCVLPGVTAVMERPPACELDSDA